ncbi:hypothetical protein NP233_g7479 [Leucocoprinus birnbaumii]|uniref:Secreted protein n=1 Tax=Leucocoprinus birnbaumii TaxID=56174 RepID=A0AAD5YSR2_9AGAR|nr:hypothetical protein NP233_g7479 [Leucocoprinus birnbaumii]
MFKAAIFACLVASTWAQSCGLISSGHPASECSDAISQYCSSPGTESINAGNEKWFCRKASNGDMCKVGGKNMNDLNSQSGAGESFPPPQDKCTDAYSAIQSTCNSRWSIPS